jgi:hypothetical protein
MEGSNNNEMVGYLIFPILSVPFNAETHTSKVIFNAQEAGKAQVSRITVLFVEPQSGPAAAFEDPYSESYYRISCETASHRPFCD